jgi:hypothetical protein
VLRRVNAEIGAADLRLLTGQICPGRRIVCIGLRVLFVGADGFVEIAGDVLVISGFDVQPVTFIRQVVRPLAGSRSCVDIHTAGVQGR